MAKTPGRPAPARGAAKPEKVARKGKRLVSRLTLRSALVTGLKEQSKRKDLSFDSAPHAAAKTQQSVPPEQRAGYPLKFPKGAVDPKDWITANGVKVHVDFSRSPWLPDDWGQGVKTTLPTSHSTGGNGGTLTAYVAPDGVMFYHKARSEEYFGRKLGPADGFNGQVRLAQLQAQQAVQLARMMIKDANAGGGQQLIGTDPDPSFFKLLSARERSNLPSKDEFHFCVVSARRATKLEGVRDIFMVQTQFLEAGVTPTWYVDKQSLHEYRALGLKAVVGGKLTAARNMALLDARKLGKACVQVSDDISAWEYREGKNAEGPRSDDAQNAAWSAAQRFIVSPVAAARFILAKMRGAEEPKPKLGGVYMLGSCARTFGGEAFARRHFILGDFFVDDGSKVLFDETMHLKEDYDFTCSHIKAHGSVMRCQRMTLNVKHYANSGGACTNRDQKGAEERRNVEILQRKWPGVFRANPKRKGEVIMRWRADCAEHGAEDETGAGSCRSLKVKKAVAKRAGAKTTVVKRAGAKGGDRTGSREREEEVAQERKALAHLQATTDAEAARAPGLWDAFLRFMGADASKSGSTRTYLAIVKGLYAQHGKSLATMAGEEYYQVMKECPRNKKGNGRLSSAVKAWTTFWAAKGQGGARSLRVKKTIAKRKTDTLKLTATPLPGFAPKAVIVHTGKDASVRHIAQRCRKVAGLTVEQAIGKFQFTEPDVGSRAYRLQDLRYDLKCGYVSLKRRGGA